MAQDNFIDYTIPNNDAYLTFDASSLRDYIIEKLNENETFTDQNYEGSNLSNIIEIISYSYHTLLFYLNKTSNESQFSDVQLLENMNRIVKLIDYKPQGYKSPRLSFTATATLSAGTYSIPRYSFFNIDGIAYSFIEDVDFIKSTNIEEELEDFSNEYILYQGQFRQNADYEALGLENEKIELSTRDKNIDSDAIDVYVKRNGTWEDWGKVDDLFFSEYNEKHYSVRLNENGNYDIIFGNDINGEKLKSGDIVSIFYLNGDGEIGEVSQNFLNNSNITKFSTSRLNTIISNVSDKTYISDVDIRSVVFNNTLPSTKYSKYEDVESIRENAPNFYKSQNRLVSKTDFESYIKSNYGGIISSVKVLSNKEFLTKHIGYLQSIGVTAPFEDSRVLANFFEFSSPLHYNNVYIYLVPRIEQKYSTLNRLAYVNSNQKQSILSKINDIKELSLDVVFQDPVFLAVDIGLAGDDKLEDKDNTKLKVVRESTRIDKKFIKDSIVNIFKTYFLPNNFDLGQSIDLQQISNDILNINGVKNIFTINGNTEKRGLNIYVWNVIYKTFDSTSQNYQLQDFQYAFFDDIENLSNKIEIIDDDA